MKTLNNKEVAIIGAGPVGLTMARLLQQEGIDVTVYERDKDASTRISGGTLDLHKGTGQDAMEKAGLLERYYAMAIPMGRSVADEQGEILFSRKPTAADQFDAPEINRNDLRKMLLGSLPSDTVVWDRRLTGLEEQDGKWLLQFENNAAATADFVIGANGGMTRVRKHVTDAEIEYTGTLIIQGEVPDPEMKCKAFYELCDDNILMIAHNGSLLVANPKNGGILSYNVMFRQPEEWSGVNIQDRDSIIAFLMTRYADWHECYKELFLATTSFIPGPTRKIALDKPWRKDRILPITLIGDAAHIMPPFAGQGVNTGLLDAMILADSLTSGKHETIEAACSDYEQKMLVYASEAQRETSKNETAMFQRDFSFLKFYR